MTRLALILAALTIPAACDDAGPGVATSGSTGDAPADSSSSGGDGYVCGEVDARATRPLRLRPGPTAVRGARRRPAFGRVRRALQPSGPAPSCPDRLVRP